MKQIIKSCIKNDMDACKKHNVSFDKIVKELKKERKEFGFIRRIINKIKLK